MKPAVLLHALPRHYVDCTQVWRSRFRAKSWADISNTPESDGNSMIADAGQSSRESESRPLFVRFDGRAAILITGRRLDDAEAIAVISLPKWCRIELRILR